MTTQQMIENAMLDALGLLSEEEQREFERAFWAADPAVQAHVRREQTRLSRIESLLPKVEPPVDLRAAVIQAVRAAMVAQLAEPEVEEVRGRGPIPILSSLHVSPVWRAASLGFAAAAAVFGATTLFMWSKYEGVQSQITTNAFLELMTTGVGGQAPDVLYRHDGVAVLAQADPAAGVAAAKLSFYRESGEGVLAYIDLPGEAGEQYTVVLIREDGEREVLERFVRPEERQGRIPLKLRPEHNAGTLQIVSASGVALLASSPLRLG
jgi:hypothetical protein